MPRRADMAVERMYVTESWSGISEADFQRRLAIERKHDGDDDVPVLSADEISSRRIPKEQRIEQMSLTMLPEWLANYERSDRW